MIKVEVIKEFTLSKFNEIKNLKRYNQFKIEDGRLYEFDTFECTKEMAEYLMGNNQNKDVVVKVIEIIPEIKEEISKTTSKKKKTTKK